MSGADTQATVDEHIFAPCSRRVSMVVVPHEVHTLESRKEGDVRDSILAREPACWG